MTLEHCRTPEEIVAYQVVLQVALRRLVEECPTRDTDWPSYRVALQNARDLLDHRLSPSDYLKMLEHERPRDEEL
jgi:hypothetical protein